jgi:hypothetical protein
MGAMGPTGPTGPTGPRGPRGLDAAITPAAAVADAASEANLVAQFNALLASLRTAGLLAV